jgi:MFS family permease
VSAAPPTTIPTPNGSRSLWKHSDFKKLWAADTISQLGTQITFLALPTAAILVLHANAFQVGLLGTMEFLPFILVGLPAGAWVDRLRRRPILIAGDLGRALILGSIPLAYAFDALHMWQLYVVAFLSGICTVFFDVSYQSYLPSLVDRDQLVDGNAKLEISRSGAQLAGPTIAGWLIQLVKAPMAILADAASYLWSAIWIFMIRKPEPRVEVPEQGHPPIRRDIAEGLRYVWRHPLLRPIAFCTANSNLWSAMTMAVFLIFAYRQLDLSPGAVGTIMALGNVGFLLGALVSGKVANRIGLGATIVGSAVMFSVPGILIPLTTQSIAWPLLIIAFNVFGIAGVIYNVNQVSLRQAITPGRMQGRMNATMRFMVWGTMPIGALAGGVLGNIIGIKPTLWVAAIGGLVSFVPPLLSPVRSLQRIPEVEPETPDRGHPGGNGELPEELAAAFEAEGEGVIEPGHVPQA